MPLLGSRHWIALGVSVTAAAAGYLVFSLWAGWHDVVAGFERVGLAGLAGLLMLSACNYALRFVRWQLFLRVIGHAQPWRPSLRIYLAGFALTTTPGKAGEALRSVFLKARGVPMTQSIAAFFSERLSDLLAVCVLCAWGVGQYPALRLTVTAAIVLLLAVFALIYGNRTLAGWRDAMRRREGRLARLAAHGLSVLCESASLHRPRVLLQSTFLSLCAWACEALAFHFLLIMLGVGQPLDFAFFVYAIGMLAGAVSFMPGGLGGTEATMLALLVLHGIPHPLAVVATLLIRVTTLWYAVVLGTIALLRQLQDSRSDTSARPLADSGEARS